MYRTLFFALALLAGSNLLAQESICRVITTERDTIEGVLVQIDKNLIIADIRNEEARMAFHPKEVLEYAVFVPREEPTHYQFVTDPETDELKPMRRQVDGPMKLYVDRENFSSRVNRGLPKGASVVPKVDVYYIGGYSDDVDKVNSHNWKTVLRHRLSDCPDLAEKIGSKGYKFRHLESIIIAYNICLERRSSEVRN